MVKRFITFFLVSLMVVIGHSNASGTVIQTWRSYNWSTYETVRDSLARSWHTRPFVLIDVNLSRGCVVTIYPDNSSSPVEQELCDAGDLYNPTITGLFEPYATETDVLMSGSKARSESERRGAAPRSGTYENVATKWVTWIYGGYAFHSFPEGYTPSGQYRSAGCIRLDLDAARRIYDLVTSALDDRRASVYVVIGSGRRAGVG